jgi:rRNA processing protein Gar1
MVLIKPLEPENLLDLDNMIAFEDRTVIGFVLELVGPVSNPLYSI